MLFIAVCTELSQTTLSDLKWMLQKDKLGQDIFLIGRPSCRRRQLAMIYSQLTQREIEFVSLSRDTTEADLKQRREIINGCATYINQVRNKLENPVFLCHSSCFNCLL